MKRIFTVMAALLIALSTMAAVPATAQETSSNTTVFDLDPAPKGYWTPDRMAKATADSMPELSSKAAKTFNKSSVKSLCIRPLCTPAQETISYSDWPNPIPDPIMHAGIEHPRTVGRIFSTKYPEGKDPIGDSCTGTVITSSSESLIITAGHCVWPDKRDATSSHITFVPAHHVLDNGTADGLPQSPFDTWDVTSAIALDCWIEQAENSCDQAILKVAPRQSDGATLQSVVGSVGLTIGGSSVRGKTPAEPYLPHLTMHSYPLIDLERFDEDFQPIEGQVYKCEESSFSNGLFLDGIQMHCEEPITGGASGAAFIEYMSGGPSVIGTFIGKVANDNDPTTLEQFELIGKLNTSHTRDLHNELDAYAP